MNTQTEEAAEKVKQYILSTGNKINENTIAHAIIFSKKFDDLIGKDADEINRLLLNFQSQEQEVKAVGDAEIEGWDMKHKPKIAEQIVAYIHEIDSLLEINRKLGEKIAELQPEAEHKRKDSDWEKINEDLKKYYADEPEVEQSDAVEFAEWISDKYGYGYPDKAWISFDDLLSEEKLTTEELYKLFKNKQ